MNKCILITHQFIKKGEEHKIEIFKFVLEYYRKHNPTSFIILTGHGIKPPEEILKIADHYYWSENIIKGEIGKGHPRLVTIGLKKAKDLGVDYVCKTRLDSIIMIPEILDYCDNILRKSKKKMINTHYYTSNYLLMDLFNYGKTDLLIKLYDPNNWYVKWDKSGLGPVAKNYLDQFNFELKLPFDKNYWESCVLKYTHIITPKDLKWIDFRRYPKLIENISIKENNFKNYLNYLWLH
jgi:hypothetical protein